MKASKRLLQSPLSYDLLNPLSLTGRSKKSVMFLHGILGSKRNWKTPANVFRKLHSDFDTITVDLRGHGESNSHHEELHRWENNTVENCSNDLSKLIKDEFKSVSPNIIVAHSFGGKVAMNFLEKSLMEGNDLPEHTWIIDSLPGPYQEDNKMRDLQSVSKIIDTLLKEPTRFASSRDAVVNVLINKGIEKSVAQWIATNIKPLAEGEEGYNAAKPTFKWGFNLPVIKELFTDFCHQDFWPFLENYKGKGKIHFIRAGKNLSWTPDILDRFKLLVENNENISFHHMPHVGHWIHVEDLHGMYKIISEGSELKLK